MTDMEPEASQNTDDTVSGQSETPSQNSLNCSESVAENEDEEDENDAEEEDEEEDFDRTESDFEDEIEQELNAMESTLPEDKRKQIQRTDTDDMVPDVKVDWSDVSRDALKATPIVNSTDGTAAPQQKGVLKLKATAKAKAKQSPPPNEENWSSKSPPPNEENWSNNWDAPTSPLSPSVTTPPVTSRQNSLNKKSSAISKQAPAKSRGPPKVADDLGALDIKSLDDKKFKGLGSSEFDYFADMAPSLKLSSAKQQAPADLLQVLSDSKTSKKT